MSKEIKTYKETPIEKVDLSKLEIDETYSCIQLGLQTIMRWDGKKFEDCISEQPSYEQPSDILIPCESPAPLHEIEEFTKARLYFISLLQNIECSLRDVPKDGQLKKDYDLIADLLSGKTQHYPKPLDVEDILSIRTIEIMASAYATDEEGNFSSDNCHDYINGGKAVLKLLTPYLAPKQNKKLIVAEMRHLLKQVNNTEISFSRMVKIINENHFSNSLPPLQEHKKELTFKERFKLSNILFLVSEEKIEIEEAEQKILKLLDNSTFIPPKKPLSEISDDDAIEVAKIGGYKPKNEIEIEGWKGFCNSFIDGEMPVIIYQYLQSKNYELPKYY